MGWDVYGVGRGHLLQNQARGGHRAAALGTCLVARLREGQHMDGLAGIARPNHARKAPTKKVVQLRCSCSPHNLVIQ